MDKSMLTNNEDLAFAVPAGIGDVSWIWSKLVTLNKRIKIYSPDAYPQRTYQWLHLLPKVIPAIGKHGYNDILTEETRRGYASYENWEQVTKSYAKGEVIYLQPNQWFLQGKSILNWIPDLETNFHYEMIVPEKDDLNGKALMNKRNGIPTLGIHMACIKGVRAWQAWMPEDWVKFLREVWTSFPEMEVALLGGLWDLDMAMEVLGLLNEVEVKHVIDLVGKTNIGEAITILKNLTYYVGFSSGLNVMCNVIDKPCTALWPKHHREHIYPHASPKQIEERRYLGFVYDDPARVFTRIKSLMKKEVDSIG